MEEVEIKNFQDRLLTKYVEMGTLDYNNKATTENTKINLMLKLKSEIMTENIDFVNNIISKYHPGVKTIDEKIKNNIKDLIKYGEYKKDFNAAGFWNDAMKKINDNIGSENTKMIYNSIVRGPVNSLIKNWIDIKQEIKPVYKLSRDLDRTMTQNEIMTFKNQLLEMKNSIIFDTNYIPYKINTELKYIDTKAVDLTNLFEAITEIESEIDYNYTAKTFDNFKDSVGMDIDEIEEIEEVEWFDTDNLSDPRKDSTAVVYTLTMIYIHSIFEKISAMFSVETFTTTPITSSYYLNIINNNITNLQTLLLIWYYNKLNGCIMVANNKLYKLDICNNYYTGGTSSSDSEARKLQCGCSAELDTTCNNPNNCFKPYCIGTSMCSTNGLNCNSGNNTIPLNKCSDISDNNSGVYYFYKDFDIYSTVFNITDISSYITIGPPKKSINYFLYMSIAIIIIFLIMILFGVLKKKKI